MENEKYEVLKNHVKFKSILRDFTETVSIVMFVKGGLFRENKYNNGIGSLFGRTWIKANNFMEFVENIGGGTGFNVSYDYTEFAVSIPSYALDKLLAELHKFMVNPLFDESIFIKEQELLLEELEQEKDNPNQLAYHMLIEHTYKNHSYSLKVDGAEESVAKASFNNIIDYYDYELPANDMIVVMSGNFTEKQEIIVKKAFSEFGKGKKADIDYENSSIKETLIKEVSDSRIQQAKLFIAYSAPAANKNDYIDVKILNEILGGGMSSLYFDVLRKKRGFAYSVGSLYPSRLCTSRLIGHIGLQYENVQEAIECMIEINKTIFQNLTEKDLAKAKNHMLGEFLSDIETNRKKAWYTAFFANLGKSFDHLDCYIQDIKAVSIERIEKLAPIFDKPHTIFTYKPEKS